MWGAETGHIHAEGVTVGAGTVTLPASDSSSGSYAFQCDAGAGNAAAWFRPTTDWTGATSRFYYLSFRFKCSGLPATTSEIAQLHIVGGGNLCNVVLTSGGKLQLWDGARSGQIGSNSTATIVADSTTYYTVQVSVKTAAGANDAAELRLDGVSVASTTTGNFSDSAPGRFQVGWLQTAPGANKKIWIDDIMVNDDQGSDNASWPDVTEKVVLLLPASDVSISGWRDTISTTDLWECINNLPPDGVSSGNDTNGGQQITSPSTGPDTYTGATTTYTAAGIGVSDTITAIMPVAEAGNSSTTGTDTAAFGLVSNPNVGVATGLSVDIATNTYPTGWNRLVGTIAEGTTANGVTRGTGANLSITKEISTTRRVKSCFMGVYVSYVPAVGGGSAIRYRAIIG